MDKLNLNNKRKNNQLYKNPEPIAHNKSMTNIKNQNTKIEFSHLTLEILFKQIESLKLFIKKYFFQDSNHYLFKQVNIIIIKINDIIKELNTQICQYQNTIIYNEAKIRNIQGTLFAELLNKEILQNNIISLAQKERDYELIKEKTGVIVCNGKIVTDGRKDNEIAILRTENSTLKNVINEKEKELEKLKSESEKSKIKNNMLIPNYSQRDFTINNNFSSTARNFYKSYKIQTKLLNSKKNNNNKTIERNTTNNFINSKDNNTIIPEEKIISVNKSRFTYNNKKITSRNNGINNLPSNNNYASCENILNKSKIKTKKKVNKSKVFYPMREFNSVRFINTQSNANKENIDNNCANSNNIKNKKKNVILKNKKDDKFRTYYGGFGLGNKK
jgi:hypothetical protein